MSDPIDFEEFKARRRARERMAWVEECQKTESGKPIPNLANAYLGLLLDPNLREIIGFDEMQQGYYLVKPIPEEYLHIIDYKFENHSNKDYTKKREYPSIITDADTDIIQKYLQLCGLTRLGKEAVQQAIGIRARENSYHPLKTYLNSLEWDGNQRLHGWLNAYLGVEHSPYASQIGTMFLIAMIARIFQPGCKADYMLILEGPQGLLKSTACATLASTWFSDSLPDLNKSDPIRISMHLRGKWLIEIAEMSSFNATESHRLKEFITQRQEQYTPKFGRNEVQEPRQCLFIGTTNQSVYLKDETGGRRFWPVLCGTIDIEALARDRDQLLAEAIYLFRNGAPWWPSREFEVEHIKPQQAARYEADIWERLIKNYLIGIRQVTALELANGPLQIPIGMIQTATNRRIASILRNLGWRAKHTDKGTVWLGD